MESDVCFVFDVTGLLEVRDCQTNLLELAFVHAECRIIHTGMASHSMCRSSAVQSSNGLTRFGKDYISHCLTLGSPPRIDDEVTPLRELRPTPFCLRQGFRPRRVNMLYSYHGPFGVGEIN